MGEDEGIQDRWDDITGALISNLLKEAVFDGFIRCRKCSNRIEPDAANCYCGWENPLVSEGLI
jgi:hypothetical protein